MIVLKNNFNHCHLNDSGMVTDSDDKALNGLFFADVRLYKTYLWQFENFELLQQRTEDLSQLKQIWGLLEHHRQTVSITRTLLLSSLSCYDNLVIKNTVNEPQDIVVNFQAQFDFQDAMSLRGIQPSAKPTVTETSDDQGYSRTFRTVHNDTELRETSVGIEINGVAHAAVPKVISLKPFETLTIDIKVYYVDVPFSADADPLAVSIPPNDSLMQQSWSDLNGLLFTTEQGVVPAAGLPRFSCPFGRDSLLTAFLMFDLCPEIAQGTLRFLAKHIGQNTVADNDEEPGKILHEYRWGPQSQLKNIPFAPYYGSADATPLFVWLWAQLCETQTSTTIETELLNTVTAAVNWILNKLHEGNGFIRFHENAKGLKFHGWKDSPASMCHADGRIAEGDIAVVEVQGYAWAALTKVQTLLRRNQLLALAEQCQHAADRLNEKIQSDLWDDDMKFYVMGLDGNDEPMRVVSSNVGHLLWANVVPNHYLADVKKRLFKGDLWSGWGFRTLASTEQPYNALSYHNGSVWPHDTALIALGLKQSGFTTEASLIATQIRALAASQANNRLPELIAGYSKTDWNPPVPYPGTCSPQAWAAAALLGTYSLVNNANN